MKLLIHLNGGTVEVWKWKSNSIPHCAVHVITYPWCDAMLQYSDDVLINRAQAWAEGCVYKHQTTSGAGTDYSAVGENLYMSTASHTTNWAIKNWVDGEIWYYDYDSKTCQDGEQCGHYTQVGRPSQVVVL